jgi:RNA polymerase sigma-70 factor (ECF subfamily)
MTIRKEFAVLLPLYVVMGAQRREIEQLYRERYAGFRRALAPVTGSYESAHDVVQEAFARALAKRHGFRREAPLGAWVWRIALRLALDERARMIRLSLDGAVDVGLVDPARDWELSEALRALPPRRRLVFFLRYFADLSYEEIALTCGISEGTVAAAIAQGRAAVAQALGESGARAASR